MFWDLSMQFNVHVILNSEYNCCCRDDLGINFPHVFEQSQPKFEIF